MKNVINNEKFSFNLFNMVLASSSFDREFRPDCIVFFPRISKWHVLPDKTFRNL